MYYYAKYFRDCEIQNLMYKNFDEISSPSCSTGDPEAKILENSGFPPESYGNDKFKDKSGMKCLNLYIGSFIIGLGTAVKYYPALFFIPAMLFSYQGDRKQFVKQVSISALLVVAGFFIGCPYFLLDFSAFISRFLNRFQLIVWGDGSGGFSLDLLRPFNRLLRAISPVLLIAAILGISALFLRIDYKKNRVILFMLSCIVVYLLFLSTWRIVSTHYLMPVLPIIILLGSAGLYEYLAKYKKVLINYAVLLICILPLIGKSVNYNLMLSKEDTRISAYKWIKNNVPTRSKILRFPYTPEFTRNDPFMVKVDWESEAHDMPLEYLESQFQYIILSGNKSEWEKKLTNHYKLVREWKHIPFASFHHPRIAIYEKRI